MKFKLFFLLSFLTLNVWSCPELAGVYKVCKLENGTVHQMNSLLITQKKIRNITQYEVKYEDSLNHEQMKEVFKADGKIYTTRSIDSETGLTLSIEVSAACIESQLIVNQQSYMAEDIFADIKSSFEMDGGKIKFTSIGHVFNKPVQDVIFCE
jgi:hypothetical protein